MPAVLDAKKISSLRALRGPGDPAFIRTYFKTFLEPLDGRLEDIRLAIESDDGARLARGAHTLRSSCLYFCANPIIDLCGQLEQLGAGDSTQGARFLYLALTPLMARLRDEISKLPELESP